MSHDLAKRIPCVPTLLVILGPFAACEVWAKNRKVAVRMSKTEIVRRWRFAMVINIKCRFFLTLEEKIPWKIEVSDQTLAVGSAPMVRVRRDTEYNCIGRVGRSSCIVLPGKTYLIKTAMVSSHALSTAVKKADKNPRSSSSKTTSPKAASSKYSPPLSSSRPLPS